MQLVKAFDLLVSVVFTVFNAPFLISFGVFIIKWQQLYLDIPASFLYFGLKFLLLFLLLICVKFKHVWAELLQC